MNHTCYHIEQQLISLSKELSNTNKELVQSVQKALELAGKYYRSNQALYGLCNEIYLALTDKGELNPLEETWHRNLYELLKGQEKKE